MMIRIADNSKIKKRFFWSRLGNHSRGKDVKNKGVNSAFFTRYAHAEDTPARVRKACNTRAKKFLTRHLTCQGRVTRVSHPCNTRVEKESNGHWETHFETDPCYVGPTIPLEKKSVCPFAVCIVATQGKKASAGVILSIQLPVKTQENKITKWYLPYFDVLIGVVYQRWLTNIWYFSIATIRTSFAHSLSSNFWVSTNLEKESRLIFRNIKNLRRRDRRQRQSRRF